MADPQASKYNTGALSDKRLKYPTATLLRCISIKLGWLETVSSAFQDLEFDGSL